MKLDKNANWTKRGGRLAAVAILLLSAQCAVAAESHYLCLAEQRVGFQFGKDVNRWKPEDAQGTERFIVEDKDDQWSWSKFGDITSALYEKCDKQEKSNQVSCRGVYDFRMNTETLRFQRIFPFGYVDQVPSQTQDYPYIEIGTCSEF